MIELIICINSLFMLYKLTNVMFSAFYDVEIKTWDIFTFSLLYYIHMVHLKQVW